MQIGKIIYLNSKMVCLIWIPCRKCLCLLYSWILMSYITLSKYCIVTKGQSAFLFSHSKGEKIHMSLESEKKKKQLSHRNNFNCLRNVHVSIDIEVVFFKQFPGAKQEPRTEWLLSAVKVHTSKVCLGISEGMATKFYII